MTPNYLVGTGIAEVTDPALSLTMQGMADPSQSRHAVLTETPLTAPSFSELASQV